MEEVGILEKISQLKQVDDLIDISRGTLQLDIMLSLSKGDEYTASELASALGQRRKAVTDALRRLRNKGLIEQSVDGKSYRLTENGIRCIDMLMDLLGIGRSEAKSVPVRREGGTAGSLSVASIVSQIVVAMGTSRGHRMTLKEVAWVIGLSPQRAQTYLDLYLDGEPKLFKKYMDETRLSRILSKLGLPKRYETYYALTQEGLQQFYKLPLYTKLKQSLSYRLLSKITGTENPRFIFRRLNFLLYGCGLASAVSVALQATPLVPLTWAFFSASIGAVAIADLFLYRSI